MKNNFPLSWQDFLYLVGSLAPPVSFDHPACQGYVAHACAKVGAVEAAYHLSGLQQKCGRTKYITAARPLLRSKKKNASNEDLRSSVDTWGKELQCFCGKQEEGTHTIYVY